MNFAIFSDNFGLIMNNVAMWHTIFLFCTRNILMFIKLKKIRKILAKYFCHGQISIFVENVNRFLRYFEAHFFLYV